MAFEDDFREAIVHALDGRSPVRVAKDAGLPRRSIETIVHGNVPGLARAARVADSLGLELSVRRKGASVVDEDALRLATMRMFSEAPGADLDKAARFAATIGRAYVRFVEMFGAAAGPDERDAVVKAAEAITRDYASRLNENVFPLEFTPQEIALLGMSQQITDAVYEQQRARWEGSEEGADDDDDGAE